jgi:indole-3-glycerol phosphate synthase
MSAATPNVLARILHSTRAELERRKRETPRRTLEQQLAGDTADRVNPGARGGRLREALQRQPIGVIAEFKRRSPSAGELQAGVDLGEVVDAYARGGASALSILTEGPHFGGSLADLRAARARVELPILRKDFILEEYQLLEAKAAGADAVLLIVAALNDAELDTLQRAAIGLELDVLVEVHDRRELDVALAAGSRLIGINNRDLRDFSVDVARTSALRAAIPPGVAVVSESGISSAAQLHALEEEQVDAVLVGEALMRSGDPAAALQTLLGEHPPARTVPGIGTSTGEAAAESETAKQPSAQF